MEGQSVIDISWRAALCWAAIPLKRGAELRFAHHIGSGDLIL